MNPGIYDDLSNEEYHASEGVSSSGLKLILDAPQLFHHQYLQGNRPEPTKAFDLGSTFHAAILEPERLETDFIACDLNRNSNAWKAFREKHKTATILKSHEMDRVRAMVDVVMQHEWIGKLLSIPGVSEQSLYWMDEETGVLCKVRPDRVIRIKGSRWCLDLKSAADARLDASSRQIHKLQYHLSAAMYLEGLRQLVEPVDGFIWITVEKEPPYLCAARRADAEMLAVGHTLFRKAQRINGDCLSSDKWPGLCPDGIEDISLPRWAA